MKQHPNVVAPAVAATLIAALALLALAGTPGRAHAKSQRHAPDLAGRWQLDEKKSESLRDVLPKLRANAGRSGGPGGPFGGMDGGPGMGSGGPPPDGGGMGGPPEGGGPGGPGGPQGEGMGPGGGAGMSGALPDPDHDPVLAILAHPPLEMTLEQDEGAVTLREHGAVSQTLVLAADLTARTGGDAGLVLAAHWQGERLQVQGRVARGAKLRETYRLSVDRQSLVVTSRLTSTGPLGTIELTRLYHRVEPH